MQEGEKSSLQVSSAGPAFKPSLAMISQTPSRLCTNSLLPLIYPRPDSPKPHLTPLSSLALTKGTALIKSTAMHEMDRNDQRGATQT